MNPAIISEVEERSIAELVGNPGFQALIRRLRGEEAKILANLKTLDEPQLVYLSARHWQFFSRLLDILESEPANAAALISNATADIEAQRPIWIDPFFPAPQVTMNIEETNQQ